MDFTDSDPFFIAVSCTFGGIFIGAILGLAIVALLKRRERRQQSRKIHRKVSMVRLPIGLKVER